jgi:hypothetical protein
MGAPSRERFRIVAEDEFLAGTCLEWEGMPAVARRDSRWARRVAGTAMVAAVSAVGGAIALSMSTPAAHLRGQTAGRTATHPLRPTSRVVARSLLASVELRAQAFRSPRREVAEGDRIERPQWRRRRLAPRPRRAVHAARLRRLAAPGAVANAGAATKTARPSLAPGDTYRPARARQPEFGFER